MVSAFGKGVAAVLAAVGAAHASSRLYGPARAKARGSACAQKPPRLRPTFPAAAKRMRRPLCDREQRIRETAYRIWEEAGRPVGQDAAHWEIACHTCEIESSSEQRGRVAMRSLDEIIADAQKAVAMSIREAFDAGRAHTATELKHRMAALFEDLLSGHGGAHHDPTPPNASHETQHSGHGQG